MVNSNFLKYICKKFNILKKFYCIKTTDTVTLQIKRVPKIIFRKHFMYFKNTLMNLTSLRQANIKSQFLFYLSFLHEHDEWFLQLVIST